MAAVWVRQLFRGCANLRAGSLAYFLNARFTTIALSDFERFCRQDFVASPPVILRICLFCTVFCRPICDFRSVFFSFGRFLVDLDVSGSLFTKKNFFYLKSFF